ncbi:phage holin family protein [Rothia amarae]|uniref:Phage holin family protein n=1 Tax=Rothia amarae TaxID=169480 RepID=A0A7H2BI77_9MICC|nr:phage holin family protein [Rothia amarae]QNV39373.1 phage holin family protein [Rothia amarae]
MTEKIVTVNPDSARAESVRVEGVRTDAAKGPRVRTAFANLKESASRSIDATKVIGRLAPKQIKDEIQIAKFELKDKGIGVGKGAAVAAVGLFFALCMLIALVSAAILGLAEIMPGWLAALVLAAVFLILTAIFVLIGIGMIKKQLPFKPESAIFGVLYDLGVLKDGSAMNSSRLKREQEEKAKAKQEEKEAKKAAEKEEAEKEGGQAPAANEDQLKQRTNQRREHLKTLRDDLDLQVNSVKSEGTNLVAGSKANVQNAPGEAKVKFASHGRQFTQNATDPEALKARWGSFAALAASVSAFFVFLGKLIKR